MAALGRRYRLSFTLFHWDENVAGPDFWGALFENNLTAEGGHPTRPLRLLYSRDSFFL